MTYSTVSKEKVITACENYLKQRQERIDKDCKEWKEHYKTKKRYWLFGANHTESDAEAALHVPMGDIIRESPKQRFEWKGGMWTADVEALLKLARLSNAEVQLSRKHVWIMDYLND